MTSRDRVNYNQVAPCDRVPAIHPSHNTIVEINKHMFDARRYIVDAPYVIFCRHERTIDGLDESGKPDQYNEEEPGEIIDIPYGYQFDTLEERETALEHLRAYYEQYVKPGCPGVSYRRGSVKLGYWMPDRQ